MTCGWEATPAHMYIANRNNINLKHNSNTTIMSKNANNVNNIFANSLASGDLGNASLDALGKIDDLGTIINNALGTPTLDISSTEIILVNMLLDDSQSMGHVASTVIDAHNELIKAIKETKQVDNIMIQCRLLNSGLLYPFKMLDDVTDLTSQDYDPDGGTPLYSSSLEILGITQVKMQECLDNFQDPRSITLIVTDGGDNQSGSIKAFHVKTLVDDMLNTENHIIAGMGFQSGGVDFKQIFLDMGLKPDWILTAASTKSEIRKAFGMFSRSVTSASKSAASFSKTAMGGFTAP